MAARVAANEANGTPVGKPISVSIGDVPEVGFCSGNQVRAAENVAFRLKVLLAC